MIHLTLIVWLAATATPPRLAAPGLSVVNLEPKLGEFYTQHLAQRLAVEGLQVVTSRDISALVGLERQQQLLGCDEQQSSNCMAELAGALGVDGVILGDIARIGPVYQLNVRVMAAGNGRPLSAYSAQVRQEELLLDELARAASHIATDLLPPKPVAVVEQPTVAAAVPVETVAKPPVGRALKGYAWIPAVVGGALAATSVVFQLGASERHFQLTGESAPAINPAVGTRLAEEGVSAQRNAAITGAAAALTLGVSAAVFLGAFDSAPGAAVGLQLAPQGAALAVSGTFR